METALESVMQKLIQLFYKRRSALHQWLGEHGWDHLITFDRDGDDHHDPITITSDRDDDEREKVKSCKNQHFSSKKCQL